MGDCGARKRAGGSRKEVKKRMHGVGGGDDGRNSAIKLKGIRARS